MMIDWASGRARWSWAASPWPRPWRLVVTVGQISFTGSTGPADGLLVVAATGRRVRARCIVDVGRIGGVRIEPAHVDRDQGAVREPDHDGATVDVVAHCAPTWEGLELPARDLNGCPAPVMCVCGRRGDEAEGQRGGCCEAHRGVTDRHVVCLLVGARHRAAVGLTNERPRRVTRVPTARVQLPVQWVCRDVGVDRFAAWPTPAVKGRAAGSRGPPDGCCGGDRSGEPPSGGVVGVGDLGEPPEPT
jgi:hypothetical protein